MWGGKMVCDGWERGAPLGDRAGGEGRRQDEAGEDAVASATEKGPWGTARMWPLPYQKWWHTNSESGVCDMIEFAFGK